MGTDPNIAFGGGRSSVENWRRLRKITSATLGIIFPQSIRKNQEDS